MVNSPNIATSAKKGSLLVWAGINIERRTGLHIIRKGNSRAQKYADKILRPHVATYTEAVGNSFLIMQDYARPHKGIGSNPGEGMDVCKCKCIGPLWQGGTLNSHRATSPLVRLVESEEKRQALDQLQNVPCKIGMELSQTVQSPGECSRLRLTTKVQLVLCPNEFHGPGFETVRQPNNDGSIIIRILLFIPTANRKRRRPRLRCADSVEYDFLPINEKNRIKEQSEVFVEKSSEEGTGS
ncbi:hypothetical protein TNCV_349991 [Trichonephila clavipes]|nr:hypothetical protein TNCV_349991 [Trichonephila clavipes]